MAQKNILLSKPPAYCTLHLQPLSPKTPRQPRIPGQVRKPDRPGACVKYKCQQFLMQRQLGKGLGVGSVMGQQRTLQSLELLHHFDLGPAPASSLHTSPSVFPLSKWDDIHWAARSPKVRSHRGNTIRVSDEWVCRMGIWQEECVCVCVCQGRVRAGAKSCIFANFLGD